MKVTTVARVAKLVHNNCGTGSGGFQPGNTCSKGSSDKPTIRQGSPESISEGLIKEGWVLSEAQERWLKEGSVEVVDIDIESIQSHPNEPKELVYESHIKSVVKGWDDGERQYVPEGLWTEDGSVQIVDGRHRIAAQKARGKATVPMVVSKVGKPTLNNCGIGPGGFQPGNTCAKGGDGPSSEPTGTKDPGERPRRPAGGFKSDGEIIAHAQAMLEAHHADPHVRLLLTARDQRQAAFDAADAKVKSAVTEEEKWEAIAERSRARTKLTEVDQALGHEGRRSMIQSFGVPISEQAQVEAKVGPSTSHARQNWEKSQDYLREVSSKDGAAHGANVEVKAIPGRAYYIGTERKGYIHTASDDDPGISSHEFGHHLENKAWVKEIVGEFREKRFDPKDDTPMAEAFPQSGYSKDEVGNPDRMLETFKGDASMAAYTGKTYVAAGGQVTEIVSMGVEQLYRDPAHFAKADPEYFALTIKVLQGVKK
jgi:hypothetical protein